LAVSAHSERVDGCSHATQEEDAIVGYDDIDFAAAAAVPLSWVRNPRDDLGHRAAELLPEEAERELVVRESSMVRRKRNGAA
jgi:LacI family transcriptional regulator